MNQTLYSFLAQTLQLPEVTLNDIVDMGTRRSATADTILFHADRPFLKLWFLEKGVIRAFRIMDGKHITFFFFTAREFASDYESYLTERESPLFFEAMVACEYIEFSKQRINELYEQYPKLEKLGRLMAERAYLSATSRLKEFQAESPTDRYLKLLERNRELFQQIPQYHIASYLGVSPQSLSRIKARLQNKS